ncbi:helix-turn-helix transcriptional regulator [Streptomyces sp. NBC_01443]|uniref:helix-turn-helix domain-containing protein n=1 Tax=Streptomyces sp. NBC_01443 TaxID=2903868 RepID=UPI00224ECAEB|nr:helix-turn-helix transcriptional regulator [Streptomyces sp. NBC_01443]MCX4632768.1 helix-turn-helix transcriptional regulator [Streptomyces sp. NBC_01443]
MTCDHCGTPLTNPGVRAGRPQKYCGAACRQAAHRARKNHPELLSTDPASPQPADTPRRQAPPAPVVESNPTEDPVTEIAHDLRESARELLRLLPDADGEEPLKLAAQMQQQLDGLTAGLVGRARYHQVTWGRVSEVLGISQDTARHRYSEDFIKRRLARLTGNPTPALAPRTSPKSSPAASPRPHRTSAARAPQTTASPDNQLAPTTTPAPSGAAYNRLAPVLSMLVRTSKQTNTEISAKIGCSPSFLSRILSGERLPTWPMTEKFAHACGADPSVLRTVWVTERCSERTRDITLTEDEESPVPAADALHKAIHTLHSRAGQPAAQDIAVASRWTLTTDEVAHLIEGTQLPAWRVLKLFVDLLGGDATHFRRLLDQATAEHGASPAVLTSRPISDRTTASPAQPPTKQPAPTALNEVIATFSRTLNHPSIVESQRARLLQKRADRNAISHPRTQDPGGTPRRTQASPVPSREPRK